MTSLVLELSDEIYEQLKNEAVRQGKQPQVLVQELIAARLTPTMPTELSEREKGRQALKEAGFLHELDPELQKLAAKAVSLEEIVQILGRSNSKPLSEIVIEQRGPAI